MVIESEYDLKFLTPITFSLGCIGYFGLLSLLKGLYKTRHLIKIISLLLGLTGYAVFIFTMAPKNFFDWALKTTPINIALGFYPIAISILFLILTLNDFKQKRNKRLLTQK